MEALRTASLHLVQDGALGLQVDKRLSEILDDCVNRAGLEKARTLTLQISVTPTGEDPLKSVMVDFLVTSKLPSTRMGQPMKHLAKNRCFGFEPDTASVEFADGQQTLGYGDSQE